MQPISSSVFAKERHSFLNMVEATWRCCFVNPLRSTSGKNWLLSPSSSCTFCSTVTCACLADVAVSWVVGIGSSFNFTSTGVMDWTSWSLPRTVRFRSTMSWLVVLTTSIFTWDVEPCFTVVRVSCTVNPSGHEANSSGSKSTGVFSATGPVLARQLTWTVRFAGITISRLVLLTTHNLSELVAWINSTSLSNTSSLKSWKLAWTAVVRCTDCSPDLSIGLISSSITLYPRIGYSILSLVMRNGTTILSNRCMQFLYHLLQ